ncbi:MAG: lectin-like protein [Gemmatimonadaceae bacterium]
MRNLRCAVAVGMLGWSSTLGAQDVVQFGSHYYERVEAQLTWFQAEAAAENLFFLGIAGHLATINSQAENDFVLSMFLGEPVGSGYRWLGGFQTPGSAEPGDGWRWVTDESFSFTNWVAGEPNNVGNDENFLSFHAGDPLNVPGEWNDLPNDAGVSIGGALPSSFVVEFDTPPGYRDAGTSDIGPRCNRS